MGKYLDQCAADAWDIISGRKKITGNKIVSVDDNEENESPSYGWLAPNGKFYPVEFGEHQEWASKYLKEECNQMDRDAGDVLCKLGFILLHNPHGYSFAVTRDMTKRITKRQEDFLVEYFESRNMSEWLDKLYRNEI